MKILYREIAITKVDLLSIIFLIVFLLVLLVAYTSIYSVIVEETTLAPEKHIASLEKGFDFKTKGIPTFLKEIKGISGVESWGRWSDANLNSSIVFIFSDDLPMKFNLQIKISPFGPNASQPLRIVIGDREQVIHPHPRMEEYSIPIQLTKKTNTIEMIPYNPVSPKSLSGGTNGDPRKLGIGFEYLRIQK